MSTFGSRNDAFGQGTGGSDDVASSLAQRSMAWNDQAPKQYSARSVLDQYMPSPNGMSERDAERRLIGGAMLPSPNAVSEQTNQAEVPLRIAGDL